MRSILAPLTAIAAFFAFEAVAQATVQIDIDLSNQTMHVTSAKSGEHDWAVSTGRPGYRTPTGYYRPQRMYVMTHSNEYEDAPMPHAIFFNGGYAIHGTEAVGSLGRVASHGCVRLAPGNAATLFDMVKHEGASIVISGHAPGRDDVAVRETHRAGQKLAMVVRKRYREEALGYAPRYRTPSLREWVNEPLGNF